VVLAAAAAAAARRLLCASYVTRASWKDRILLGIVLAALAVPAVAEGPRSWRRVEGPARSAPLTALAVDGRGHLAVAAEGRVWVRGAAGWRSQAVRGPLSDLAFDGGALWIAGEQGVWWLSEEARLEPRHPGAGERDRRVARIAVLAGLVAAAGDGGVFARAPGGPWQALREGIPSRPATAILLRKSGASEGTFEIWSSVDGSLYRAVLRADGETLEATPWQRVALDGPGGGAIHDLAEGPGGSLVALGAGWLAAEVPDAAWTRHRLVLPPGAEARRVRFAAGGWLLASDRGVLLGRPPETSLQRAEPPVGRAAALAVEAAGSVVYAATEEGLFESWPERSVPAAELRLPPERLRDDPAVGVVQRAALIYLGLGPARMRDLRRRADRRGWLPRVDLRAGAGLQRDRSRDFDQSFVSGALRELLDEELDRRHDASVSLTLSWDLGDGVFDPEVIDLSREARAVIELRDDVLDEINRLYFERRRILVSLAGLDPGDGAEAIRLRLRADELAAGLDSWTGGWFSRHTPRLASALP
jgi:hypothetical protein